MKNLKTLTYSLMAVTLVLTLSADAFAQRGRNGGGGNGNGGQGRIGNRGLGNGGFANRGLVNRGIVNRHVNRPIVNAGLGNRVIRPIRPICGTPPIRPICGPRPICPPPVCRPPVVVGCYRPWNYRPTCHVNTVSWWWGSCAPCGYWYEPLGLYFDGTCFMHPSYQGFRWATIDAFQGWLQVR